MFTTILTTILSGGSKFLDSKYSTLLFAFLFGIASYFYINTKMTISNQAEQIQELNSSLGVCSEKIKSERTRSNEALIKDALLKNLKIERERNERLQKANSKLSEKNKITTEDNLKINSEINKLKNKKCLNNVIDEKTKESLNKIFNGE